MSDAADFVIDNYKLVNCISTGQHSQIWEVLDTNTNERWAMKLLMKEAFAQAEQRNALKHEAQVAKSLDHPNIIHFHSVKFSKKYAYYTMELFRANSVKALLQTELPTIQGRLKRLIELTGLALGHVHEKGWIHRDVKPDNILFTKGAELRLIDFSLSTKPTGGLAAFFGGKTKLVQGTRTYMAPEQIRGQRLTIQTDIYNFGVSIFEMLTGRSPFAGSSPNDLLRRHLTETPAAPSLINPNVTPEMDRFVLKMLAKKPENRHKNTNEMLAEFRTLNVFKQAIDESVLTDEATADKAFTLGERRNSRTDALRQKPDQPEQGDVTPAPATVAPKSAPPKTAPAAATQAPPATKPAAVTGPAPTPAKSNPAAASPAPAKPAAASTPTSSKPAAPPATVTKPAAPATAPKPAAPAPAATKPAAAPPAAKPAAKPSAAPPASKPAAPPAKPAASKPAPQPAPVSDDESDVPDLDDFKIL